MKTVLTNCNVIDCTGQPAQLGMSLVMEGDKINALQAGPYSETGDARVFDLAGAYVLPGLWAVHTHLGAIFPDAKKLTFKESAADAILRAARNCTDALRVGITGIRSVGDRDGIDLSLRRAFDMGLMVGPRIFACGNCIIATGGHGHGMDGCIEVDGPYEMRRAVRDQLKRGADQIKLAVTGGVATAGEGMTECQLFLDEIKAATDVAHEKGKRVCVHAGGPEGIKTAILGGVDCIEHGYYIDDESIAMMAEQGTYWVPTLFVTQYQDFMRASGMADYQIEKASGAAKIHREGFQKAIRAGIKIACGADSSPISEHTLVEVEQLVAAGMTEMQALIAATRTSADLCGVADRLGTVEPGKLADLLIVGADPLADISNIRQCKMVFKGGNLVDTAPIEGLADFWELYF